MNRKPSPSTSTPPEATPPSPVLVFTPLMAALVVAAFLLGVGIGYLAWGRATAGSASAQAGQSPSATQPSAQQAAGQPTQSQKPKRYEVPVDDDYILGPDDAPITIIEFSDYQCPYCRKWALEVLPLLKQNYPDQFRLIYRDFPLTNIHPEALPAAVAANCAGEQGQYYAYHDALFNSTYPLGSETYQKLALDLGLDRAKFSECLASNRYRDEVVADLDWASQLGVQSTPTFFINGIALVGAQPFEVFKDLIDKELAGELQ